MATKDKFYFQQIAELVHDDNKIVTSTTFSAVVKIKVNEAQDILDKYAKSADNISCTYLITGYTKNGVSILLSKTNELKKKQAVFNNIISQHIYSIQKSDTDTITLENTEPFNENISSEPLLGSVVSNKAVRRKLKKKEYAVKEEKQLTETKDKNNVIKQERQSVETKLNKPKTSSIANFCVAGNNVQNIKPVIGAKSKQKNMMAGFFSKTQKITEPSENLQTSKDTKKDLPKSPNVKDAVIIKTNETESQSMEVDDNTKHVNGQSRDKEENIESKNDKSQSESLENTGTKHKENKKRKKAKSNSNQQSKKRKRIVETQDSDSDMFASSESENEADNHLSDDVENFEEKHLDPIQPQKTRTMKQVTEEFMDEDGYMNTVQKYVIVSGDEEEDKDKNQINKDVTQVKPAEKNLQKGTSEMAPISNKNKKSSPVKKNNKNGKSKVSKGVNQASIMDFFKKN